MCLQIEGLYFEGVTNRRCSNSKGAVFGLNSTRGCAITSEGAVRKTSLESVLTFHSKEEAPPRLSDQIIQFTPAESVATHLMGSVLSADSEPDGSSAKTESKASSYWSADPLTSVMSEVIWRFSSSHIACSPCTRYIGLITIRRGRRYISAYRRCCQWKTH